MPVITDLSVIRQSPQVFLEPTWANSMRYPSTLACSEARRSDGPSQADHPGRVESARWRCRARPPTLWPQRKVASALPQRPGVSGIVARSFQAPRWPLCDCPTPATLAWLEDVGCSVVGLVSSAAHYNICLSGSRAGSSSTCRRSRISSPGHPPPLRPSPTKRLVRLTQPTAIPGQEKGNGRVGLEILCHGDKKLCGLLGAAKLVKAVGAVNPAERALWPHRRQRCGTWR